MNVVHLVKTYCLFTLTYGSENGVFCENTKQKIKVTWHNCRHSFNCCWCEGAVFFQSNPICLIQTAVVPYPCHTRLIWVNCFSGKNVY